MEYPINYNLVNPYNLCASDNRNPPHDAYALATVGREVQMGRNPQAGQKKLKLHRHRKNHLHSAQGKEEDLRCHVFTQGFSRLDNCKVIEIIRLVLKQIIGKIYE